MNTEQKIAKLTLRVNEYLKYTIWTNVGITVREDIVFVTWFSPVMKGDSAYLSSTLRFFPIEDIDLRIESFRNKINYEKKEA